VWERDIDVTEVQNTFHNKDHALLLKSKFFTLKLLYVNVPAAYSSTSDIQATNKQVIS
jgi:hypothetical protein